MISNHIVQELILNLPTIKHYGPGSVYLTHCTAHTSEIMTLVVDFERDCVVCMNCGFSGTTSTLLDALDKDGDSRKTISFPIETRASQSLNVPWDNYGHLITEEVSQAIHDHLFSSKVKELNTAVEQLAQLISRMKLWIDPK